MLGDWKSGNSKRSLLSLKSIVIMFFTSHCIRMVFLQSMQEYSFLTREAKLLPRKLSRSERKLFIIISYSLLPRSLFLWFRSEIKSNGLSLDGDFVFSVLKSNSLSRAPITPPRSLIGSAFFLYSFIVPRICKIISVRSIASLSSPPGTDSRSFQKSWRKFPVHRFYLLIVEDMNAPSR